MTFLDLTNLLVTLFTSHMTVWTGSFHLFLLCILGFFVLPFSQIASTSRPWPDQQVACFPSKNRIALPRRHHTSLPFFSKKENMGCGFDFSFLLQTSCPESNISTSFMDFDTFQIIKAQIQQSKFKFKSHKFYIKLYINYHIRGQNLRSPFPLKLPLCLLPSSQRLQPCQPSFLIVCLCVCWQNEGDKEKQWQTIPGTLCYETEPTNVECNSLFLEWWHLFHFLPHIGNTVVSKHRRLKTISLSY